MNEPGPGLLAIWSTVTRDFETDYLHWLTREHVFERVGVPGFRSGRVLRRPMAGASEYVILYELDNANVMSSEGYRARLDSPTPWTQRIMPRLAGFRRGGGTVLASTGNADASGSRVSIARFLHEMPEHCTSDTTPRRLDAIVSVDRVTGASVMQVATDATGIATREKSMRRGDEGSFVGAILIESLDDLSAAAAIEVASGQLAIAVEDFEVYELVFTFHRP
jgi:hypothetical protein